MKTNQHSAASGSLDRLVRVKGYSRERLLELIGYPPEGFHSDEWLPRGETWHGERVNWTAEVERLRRNLNTATKIVNRQIQELHQLRSTIDMALKICASTKHKNQIADIGNALRSNDSNSGAAR